MAMIPKPILCDPKLFEKDLREKTYIVTGANSGIGFTTTQQLVKQGATVIMACRNPKLAEDASQRIAAQNLPGVAQFMQLDLSDLSSVRRFVEHFHEEYDRLDALVNNAGVMAAPYRKTTNGFELQFGVNHLGHFLLCELLLNTLKKSAPSRIVILTSSAHDSLPGNIERSDIDFDDLHFEKRKYNRWIAYGQSKLANFLHAKALARRLEGCQVTAVSVHPGWIETNLQRHIVPAFVQALTGWAVRFFMGVTDAEKGAHATLHAL
ncbi:MAG: SDR family oxidoreductase, partial [Myxococcota bacterium]|nr:SDR family oxidoreductase [Myxococcota bacterium]